MVNKAHLLSYIKRMKTIKGTLDSNQIKVQTHFGDVVQDIAMIKSQLPTSNLDWMWKKLSLPERRLLYPVQQLTRIEDREKGHIERHVAFTVLNAGNVPCRSSVTKSVVTPFLTSPSVRRVSSIGTLVTRKSNDITQEWNHSDLERDSSPSTNLLLQAQFQGRRHQLPINNTKNFASLRNGLEIPLTKGNTEDFSPLLLKELLEPIQITVFDQIEVDIGKEGGYYEHEITTLKELRYIGQIDIPLSSIYEGRKIEQIVPLIEPSFIIGYEKLGVNFSTFLDIEGQHLNTTRKRNVYEECQTRQTSINIILAINPPISVNINEIDDQFLSNESDSCTREAKIWMNNYSQNPRTAKRFHNILMAGPNGKHWLITRFLKKQCPPEGFNTMEQCAHFVSLIPFLNNWERIRSKPQIKTWSSSQMFLDIIAGDWEEHAALLANYFIYLSGEGQIENSSVFLVFGFSIADGNVVSIELKDKPTNIELFSLRFFRRFM